MQQRLHTHEMELFNIGFDLIRVSAALSLAIVIAGLLKERRLFPDKYWVYLLVTRGLVPLTTIGLGLMITSLFV